MKNFLLLSFTLVLSAATSYAFAQTGKQKPNVEQMKYGIQAGSGILSSKIGAYYEYTLTDKLGLQSGLSFFHNSYGLIEPGKDIATTQKFSVVNPTYISLPIILKVYPGADRQFSFFAGIQAGYLIEGSYLAPKSIKQTPEEWQERLMNLKKEDFEITNIKSLPENNQLELSSVLGFDYEFGFGLTLGITYTKGFIDVIKTKKSVINWAFQPTIGYNIAKLFR